MTRLAGAAVLALSACSLVVAAGPAPRASARPQCASAGPEQTTVIIDGDLYGMIRSQDGRYLFGWSGDPVLTLEEAFRLMRALGVQGTYRQLVALGSREIVGGAYADGGSIAYFTLHCPGAYRATVLVRRRRLLPATRIWLHEERGRVTRAFCMRGQWLPGGARLSVVFRAPLASEPPRFTIDRDADGLVDRTGRFRAGGAGFPSNERC